MLNVTLVRDYVSKKGNDTFVYAVFGDAESLKAFKKAKGTYYREDDGKSGDVDAGTPIWFTTRCIGNTGKLIITEKGNVIADMSEFRKAQSMSEQFGGNFGQELARASVANLLGNKPTSDSEE
tara:strand:+ start:117 stop:485 length:369 start_codon:yes stop_codon:yes gene_type:complete